MSLGQVIAALTEAGVGVTSTLPDAATLERVRIRRVRNDSRQVRRGDLFVAWRGAAHDAHDHLGAATEAGAAAAIVERPAGPARLPRIQVDNARRAAAVAADFVAGSPSRALRLAGITGTNGKTTTALLLRGLLAGDGPAAAIGTLGVVGAEGRVAPGTEGLTTPGPVELANRLAALVRRGVRSVVLETSSHALDQLRLDGLRFDVTAFTNLTRDHLDYHGSFERYLAAKARLLELGKPGAVAVVNADDPAWASLRPTGPVLRYGMTRGAAVTAEKVELTSRSSRFILVAEGRRLPVHLPLAGDFNISNALCAAACALALGHDPAAVARGLDAAQSVPGRLQRLARDPFDVFVDFAHTPDALEKLLRTLRPLVSGRLIVVFGAGGDRDPTKRAPMGAAVARHADLAVITSDNPRTEDPAAIVAEVAAGVTGLDSAKRRAERVEIVDRREAIVWALGRAGPGDLVLLAGKGHEEYQVVGDEKRPFSEREIVRTQLEGGRR